MAGREAAGCQRGGPAARLAFSPSLFKRSTMQEKSSRQTLHGIHSPPCPATCLPWAWDRKQKGAGDYNPLGDFDPRLLDLERAFPNRARLMLAQIPEALTAFPCRLQPPSEMETLSALPTTPRTAQAGCVAGAWLL